jgi:hypothetical protein
MNDPDWSSKPPCGLIHRLFYWRLWAEEGWSGCMGDGLNVTYHCLKCKKVIFGDTGPTLATNVKEMRKQPLRYWQIGDSLK